MSPSHRSVFYGPVVVTVALFVAAGPGCADPTEVVLFVDTSLGVPCQVDRIEVTVTGAEDERITRTADPRDGLQSISVVQDGDGTGFSVDAVASKDGVPVANATANATFQDESRRSLALTLDNSCRTQTCDLSDRLQDFSVPSPATRLSCVGISSRYSVGLNDLQPVTDACEVAVDLQESLGSFSAQEIQLQDEDLLTALNEDFDFRFYGETIQSIWVADDGYVAFGAEAPGSLAGQVRLGDLAAPGAPRFAVVPFWDNLQVRSDACAALTGDGDRQELWLTWSDACFLESCGETDRLTFSVGLLEDGNRIVIGFLSMASGADPQRALGSQAAVGIRGPAPSEDLGCLPSECNQEGLCSNGTPCGYTQYSARTPQDDWTTIFEQQRPVVLEFTPVPEE